MQPDAPSQRRLRLTAAAVPAVALAAVALAAPPWRAAALAALLVHVGAVIAHEGVTRALDRSALAAPVVPDRFVSELRADEAGPVAVEGVVRAAGGERLVAPLSDDECLWFEVRLERLERDAAGEWRWRTVERHARALPFDLQDDSGRVRVHAHEATELVPPWFFVSVNPEHAGVRAWHAARGSEHALGRGLDVRHSEARVREGDLVLVHARVRRGDAGVEAVADRVAPAADAAIASAAVPPAVERRALRGVAIAIVGLLIVFGGAFALADAVLAGEAVAALARAGR